MDTLNILLQTKSHDVLKQFIRVGGYRLLNAWLIHSKNTPLLLPILLTLQKLLLKVDHLKQNNTAKLVKQHIKSADTEVCLYMEWAIGMYQQESCHFDYP